MNKSANVFHLAYYLIIITAGIFASVIVLKVISQMSSNGSDFLGTEANNVLIAGGDAFSFLDIAIPIVFVLLSIVFIVSMLYVRTSPVLMFFSLFVLGILIIIAVAHANAIDQLDNQTVVENETDTFSRSISLGKNLPLIIVIVGGLGSVVLYGLWSYGA